MIKIYVDMNYMNYSCPGKSEDATVSRITLM